MFVLLFYLYEPPAKRSLSLSLLANGNAYCRDLARGNGTLLESHRRSPAPPPHTVIPSAERKVPVIYYLYRNGRLQQPHFLELPVPSTHALRLRDVIRRLDTLRGKGFADFYSWSSKRSYKNGFVWCDLAEDDVIHPTNGVEYVLKGSELVRDLPPPASISTSTSSCEEEISKSANADADLALLRKVSSFEYRICRSESAIGAVDASTQTEDRRRQCKRDLNPEEDRGDLSPPPPSSSPETGGTLTVDDGRLGISCSGRARASAALMNLITCGAVSVERRQCASARLDDDRCFSGGLIVTGRKGSDGAGGPAELQRSSSYDADRLSKLEFEQKEMDEGACIKTTPKKLGGFNIVGAALSGHRSHGSSKRISNVEVPHK